MRKFEKMNPRLDLDETVKYVRALKTGSHGVFFYETPAEKREVLFNYLQAGIQNGEGAIYVASQETSTQIRRQMEAFGLDVRALEREGMLGLYDCDGWYMVNGAVDVSHAMLMGYSAVEAAMELGLKGLRSCGEAACFFDHEKETELMEYELLIGRKLALPATALCAYDVNHATSLEAANLFRCVKAHGPIVTAQFAQEVAFETFFPAIMEEVLEGVFGELGKELILVMLDPRHSLISGERERRIADDPAGFVDRLEDLLGSGAVAVKQSMAREVLGKMGIT
jgi:hypothetical protein